jgi:hypothetical protein
MVDQVELLESANAVSTSGLQKLGMPEIAVSINDSALIPEIKAFLEFVVRYLSKSSKRINSGETIQYGFWVVLFQRNPVGILEVWEYAPDGKGFVLGCDVTLRCWREQHHICNLSKADFAPPNPDQLVVISEGVFEGLAVQGVRYPSPEHMSGWWITTDRYDGNIKSLKHEHCYHLCAKRPDLTKYLALPHGYRFDLARGQDIWFDENVSKG